MKDLALLLAPGFEESEALVVYSIVSRAGLTVDLLSCDGEKQVAGSHGATLVTDGALAEHRPSDYRALYLPGGLPGAYFLRDDRAVQAFLKEAWDAGLYVAAVCAAPIALGRAGLTAGRKGTCYPGFEAESGFGENRPELTVRHGRLLTGKGPATAQYMGMALVEVLAGPDARRAVYDQMLYPLVKERQQKNEFFYQED